MLCNKNGLRRCLYGHSAYCLLVAHGDVGAEGNVAGRERKSTLAATSIAKVKAETGAVCDIVLAGKRLGCTADCRERPQDFLADLHSERPTCGCFVADGRITPSNGGKGESIIRASEIAPLRHEVGVPADIDRRTVGRASDAVRGDEGRFNCDIRSGGMRNRFPQVVGLGVNLSGKSGKCQCKHHCSGDNKRQQTSLNLFHFKHLFWVTGTESFYGPDVFIPFCIGITSLLFFYHVFSIKQKIRFVNNIIPQQVFTTYV